MEKVKVIISNRQKEVKIPTGTRMLVRRCCNAVLRNEKFEGSAEIKSIFISYQFSDFLYFHFLVVQEKPFSFVHTQACQVFGWRFTGIFFKYFSSSSQIFFWSKRPESVRKASNSPASD